MNDMTKSILIGIGALTAIFGLNAGYFSLVANAFTPEDGAMHLAQKGYTDIQGGESASITFNACLRGSVARAYEATNTAGKDVDVKVCFHPIYKEHISLFSK